MARTKSFTENKSELVNVLLIILFISAFQGYWLYSVYTNQKNIIIKESQNILREQVLNNDTFKMVSQLKSADTSPTVSQLADLIGELSKNKNVQIKVTSTQDIPKDTLLGYTPEEISQITQQGMEGKKPTIKSDTLILKHIKTELNKNFKHLNFEIKTNTANKNTSGLSSVKVYSQVDPRQFYQLIFTNLNTAIIKEILPSILLSFLYIAVCVFIVVLLIKNIHKRKKLIQMKDNFTSSMTHEFKTPLSTLYAATEALGKYGVLDDRQMAQEYIQLMQGELKRLSLMTESILNNARLEAGKLDIKPEKTNVSNIINDAIHKLSLRIENSGATINTQPITAYLYANLDNEHFINVLCNLIDNSIKYSDEPAIITIEAHKKGSELEIIYSDNSIGIPDRYRDDVFKPYFRIMENNIYKAAGHGLGLSYVKEVITLHNGTIRLIKNTSGKGSAFQILLPLINE